MNSSFGNNGVNSKNNLSLQAAAKAAAQINAQLAAEGKLQQPNSQNAISTSKRKENKTKTSKKDLFSAEVEINDLPPRVRNLLTKGYIQEQIQWRSKAALCTKGRYISAREKPLVSRDDRPLYICVQSVEKRAVDEAVNQIQQFIAEHNGSTLPPTSVPPPTVVPNHHPPPSVPLIQDKVYINLDHAPQSFNLLQRVLGPGGTNILYITSETGVSVVLRGKGYVIGSDEPLHLLLEHVDLSAVQNARSLALSLVGTLQQEFVQWQQSQQSQQQHLVYITQPIYGGSVGNGAFHYPALAMVYGVDGNVHNPSNGTREKNDAPGTVPKRASRFDFQQHAGNSPGDSVSESVAKRQKMANQLMYQP